MMSYIMRTVILDCLEIQMSINLMDENDEKRDGVTKSLRTERQKVQVTRQDSLTACN